MRNFKKFLALLLATMMVLGGMVTVSAAEEAEATEAEAVETVDYDAIYQASAEDLAALDILKGDGIDFALENGVTRWQMALFIARIMTGETDDQYWNKVTDNTTPYDDVTNYFGAISYADENGIIKGRGWMPGVGDNCFDPNSGITYAEALTMAVRALGEKQLAYPNGFITVAGELGLTDGLETLDNDTELTRGQMVQILKNMLYCEIDGTSYAQKNFGLEEQTYVLVATNLQYMPGTDRTVNPGYVQLAKLKADGTYDFNVTFHFTEEELDIVGESELKIGYSYTIASFDEFETIYSVEENATKIVKNYGDYGKSIVAQRNLYNAVNKNVVKIDDVAYTMVKSFSNLNNKPTYVGQNNELIVHHMYEGEKNYNTTFYWYDAQGNIVDGPGSSNVLLYFIPYAQIYCVKNADGSWRVANEKDFDDAAVKVGVNNIPQYGVINDAAKLTTISFSQITMIDDNNDGIYDRAVYIPYSVGKYETKSEKGAWLLDESKAQSGETKHNVVKVDSLLTAWVTANDEDNRTWSWQEKSKIKVDDITFIDTEGNAARPDSGDYVVYYYNPYTRIFVTVENLETLVAGKVEAFNQGTLVADATNGGDDGLIYSGSTVTIDGVTYPLGYRKNEAKTGLTGGDKRTAMAENAWDDSIYVSWLQPYYKPFKYLVLADRVIALGNSTETDDWMIFDYGTDLTQYTNGNVSVGGYKYSGDILGVDEDGYIMVKGYVNSGEVGIHKINSINGYSFGLLVEDYARMTMNFPTVGYLNNGQYDTMKKIVINSFFKQLTAQLTTADARQLVYIVTGQTEDGAYDIYTDIDLYWADAYTDNYRQPETHTVDQDLVFKYGITTKKISIDEDDAATLTLNKDSVILIAGKNKINTYTGIPENNNKLDIHDNDCTIYAIGKNLIVVASATKTPEEIYKNDTAAVKPDKDVNSNVYTYYLVAGSTINYDDSTTYFNGFNQNGDYVYNNMYNLNTGSKQTIEVNGGLEGYKYANTVANALGNIYATKDGENFELVKIAGVTEASAVLTAILSDVAGTTSYASPYDHKTTLSGKADVENQILKADGTLYDMFSFKYKTIEYKYDETGKLVGISVSDKKTTEVTDAHKTGDFYYSYEEKVSYKGLCVFKSGTLPSAAETAALKTARENAIKALTDAAAGLAADLKIQLPGDATGAVYERTVAEWIAAFSAHINGAQTVAPTTTGVTDKVDTVDEVAAYVKNFARYKKFIEEATKAVGTNVPVVKSPVADGFTTVNVANVTDVTIYEKQENGGFKIVATYDRASGKGTGTLAKATMKLAYAKDENDADITSTINFKFVTIDDRQTEFVHNVFTAEKTYIIRVDFGTTEYVESAEFTFAG